MKVWLVTIGEPIPHPQNRLRLHRTGILAKYISENSAHKVLWWTSAFNHFTKEHVYSADEKVRLSDNYEMYVLKGKGYARNISADRITDHRQIAEKFRELALLEDKPDVIVAAFPTLGLCQAAIQYGQANNVPVVVDYRDMWPEVFVEILPGFLRFAGNIALYPLFSKTNKVFGRATGLIGITEEFLNLGLKKASRNRNSKDAIFPLGYLDNQYNEDEFNQALTFWKDQGVVRDDLKNIVFFGTLGYQFDLNTVVEAAKLPGGEKYRFVICGTGDHMDNLRRLAGGYENLYFPGYMSAAQIKALMNISDYGLCPYIPKKAFLNSIPGKAIEYFSSGLPILTTLESGLLGTLVNENKIGSNYTAYSPESLLKALDKLNSFDIKNTKKRILDLYNKEFNAKIVYSNYLKYLENIVHNNR